MLHVCCFLMGKHEERETFAKPRGRCEDDIKMLVKKGERVCDAYDQVILTWGKDPGMYWKGVKGLVNFINILLFQFFKKHTLILSSLLQINFLRTLFLSVFPTNNTYEFILIHGRYMLHPPLGNTDPGVRSSGMEKCQDQGSPLPPTQSPKLIRVNYIWREVNVIKLRTMRIPPSSSYFFPLSSKYSPQEPASHNCHI